MGHPVAVWGDYMSGQLRALATRCRNADQVRRLLSIAAVADGASCAAAAQIGAWTGRRCAIDLSPRRAPASVINSS